ncbi:GH1 family beta-glucosidase [Tessaracoccus defluvii]|uniref:Beta-glucosidase n=1 Tax=Tessaracoccus defluvii TaxID=1285901 RepID=A0A7H0H9M9_9ACTN|nr:GH1 family beta-glucosidase [Tessaracoccus defluvii]QNP57245.1 beta-glucosidase [Tessaracoccus defluvii]
MFTHFPKNFLWGAATAAAQVEGAAHVDGKEDSVWDAFARQPLAVAGGDTPEIAADHYNRMPEDVALMKRLGLQAYRFSTSWARVRPGDRYTNEKGLDFYDRLVDELLRADILPWLTLYHWDLPQALQEQGGWANRETAERFVRYAEDVYGRLGDRVRHWTTFNEPLCSSLIGYVGGEHAPGLNDPAAGLAALHHQHLAHGRTVSRLRELGGDDLQLGITLNLTNAVPFDPADPADLDAARRLDGLWNRMYLDPVLLGSYPEDVLVDIAGHGFADVVQDGDLAEIFQPIDFLGVNHYHDDCFSAHPAPETDPPALVPTPKANRSWFVGSEFVSGPSRGLPRTGMGWEVNPDGLRILLHRLVAQYPNLPALYITENGAAYDDVLVDGRVDDHDRWDYIEAHLAAVGQAMAEGVPVLGYFVWSLLDNFEWAWGYGKRFGIVHVDYDTQVRTPKLSAENYAAVIAEASGT